MGVTSQLKFRLRIHRQASHGNHGFRFIRGAAVRASGIKAKIYKNQGGFAILTNLLNVVCHFINNIPAGDLSLL